MYYDIKESGKRIHQLRIQSGYTQEKLAEELNIDRSFYSRVEAGKKGCSIDLFIQFSNFFNVSLDYLILGRYLDVLIENTDKAQLKNDIETLMVHLQQFNSIL